MEVSRQKGRESHSQTVNIDLSLPDRDRELGLASIHKAQGLIRKRGVVDEVLSSIPSMPTMRQERIEAPMSR